MPKAIQTQTGNKEVFAQAPTGASQSAEMRGLGAIAGAAYEGMAQFGEELSALGERLARPEMASRGAQSVTRDPNTGELTVELRTPLNSMDEAYNHAAKAAFASQSEGDTRLALQKMAQEHLDDPEKFRVLATQYVKTLAGGKGVPSELRGDILNTGLQNVEQFTGNLVSQKQARDTRSQLAEVKSNIEAGWNDVYALAHKGGTDTPDFLATLAKTKNLYGTLQNPVFGMSKAMIENEINEKVSAAYGEAALGQGLSEAKKHGVQAGLDFIDKAVWSEKLNLSPAQRESFAARGKREIGEWDALQRDAATELRQIVASRLDDARAKAEATGKWQDVISPDQVARAYPNNPEMAADILSDLNSRAGVYSMRKQVANASPADIVAMETRLNPANTGAPPPAVTIRAADAHSAINTLFPGATITSEARTPEHNAKVGGVPNSLHLSAQALDFILPQGTDPASVRAKLVAQGLPISELINEGDHIHWAWGSKEAIGFADQQRQYTAFQQAVQERNQALAKDPAGYAIMARPEVAAMLQSQDLQTFQNGVRSSLQVQRDLGVLAPKILPSSQTAAIVQAFNNPEDPNKRADHMVSIIGNLEQRYGKYFPQAMAELQKAGLPSEAVALAQVKNDPAVAARMAQAVNAGRQTLRKVTAEANDIDKAVVTSLSAFNKTLAGQSGNSRVAAQQAEAAQLYAYQLAQEGAPNPGERAVQDIIGKHFAFNDTYRVPTGIDPGQVEAGARTLLRELPATAIMPETSLADPRITPETRKTMSSQILKAKGVWLTLPDDSGLYLAYPQETGFVPGRLSNGKIISFPWAALTGAAARIQAQPGQVYFSQ